MGNLTWLARYFLQPQFFSNVQAYYVYEGVMTAFAVIFIFWIFYKFLRLFI